MPAQLTDITIIERAGARYSLPIADITDVIATSPAAPATGRLRPVRNSVGGRQMLGVLAPVGRVTTLQQHLARGYTAWFRPHGQAASGFTLTGMASFALVGTQTVRSVATTSRFSRMLRWSTVSAATAGSFAAIYGPSLLYTIGNGAGDGGFHFVATFGSSDAVTVSGARMFVGFQNSAGAPTNVEPSTLTNCIGIGHGAADTAMMLYYGGSAAQAPINLNTASGTSDFPANTLSIDPYELSLFASSADQNVGWRVENLRTGTVVQGTIANSTPGVTLPANTAFLTYRFQRTNNATALAVGIDIMSFSIEREY